MNLAEPIGIIISAFPGVGKSYFCENSSRLIKVTDSDSSGFDKADFPKNYIDHVMELQKTNDYILVSSHSEVRDEMAKRGLDYRLVYPMNDCKHEYLERYVQRGSEVGLITAILNNWEAWRKTCNEDTNALVKYQIGQGRYLTDVLPTLLNDCEDHSRGQVVKERQTIR